MQSWNEKILHRGNKYFPRVALLRLGAAALTSTFAIRASVLPNGVGKTSAFPSATWERGDKREVALGITSCIFDADTQICRMYLAVETEQESDGRWIAEIAQIPGALSYGSSREEAICKVEALALRVFADRLEHGEMPHELQEVFSVAA